MDIIKPGLFSLTSHADVRRNEFDLKNETLLKNNVSVDYLFIGDSITARWEIQAYFNELGCIINRGISGDNARYLKLRVEADAIQLKPKNIILWIGVNDTMFIGTDYIKVNKSEDVLLEGLINNIKEIINLIKMNSIKVIVCSIWPINIPNCIYNKSRNVIIKQANECIKNYCREMQIDYVDMHSKIIDIDGYTLKDGYTSDGVHPNVEGYDFASKEISKVLSK